MTERTRARGADDELVGELVAAAQANGAWAFTRLYERFAGPVAGYLRAQGATEPEDLTSEVFLSVFTGIGRFTGDGADFRSWLFTIAHRRLIDARRRRGRRVATSALDGLPERGAALPGGDAETEAIEGLGTERVVALLSELSPDQRDVLTLRILGDLTVEQVAEAVGKRPGAVKALQRRGLEALRRRFSEEGVPL
jgi:RNA polymerase sigma factor (sigma-70 family)